MTQATSAAPLASAPFQRILRQPFSPQRQVSRREQRERLMRSQALPLIAQSVDPRLENERQRSEAARYSNHDKPGAGSLQQVTTVIPGENSRYPRSKPPMARRTPDPLVAE